MSLELSGESGASLDDADERSERERALAEKKRLEQKPCGTCGSVLDKDQQAGGRDGAVRCGPCRRTERLQDAEDTDPCGGCGAAIGTHRALNVYGALLLCAGCHGGTSAQVTHKPTTARTAGASKGGLTAEEEVAAELEKLMGPPAGARQAAAATASGGARSRSPQSTAEEEVAGELERLMGPAPNRRSDNDDTEAVSRPAAAAVVAGVTEAELIAAMEDLDRQRAAARRAMPVAAQKKLSPRELAAELAHLTAPAVSAPRAKTARQIAEEEVAAELEKLMGSPPAA